MNRLDYISLFTKKVIGSISANEADQLTEMSNDPNSKAEIEILQKIWDASANYSPELSFSASETFQKFKKDQIVQSVDSAKIKSKFSRTFILGALAVVAIVASLLFFNLNNSSKTISNSTSDITTHELNGTKIWLNTEASVKQIESTENATKISVNGFAYIDNSQSEVLIIEDEEYFLKLNKAKVSIYKNQSKSLEISIEDGSVVFEKDGDLISMGPGETLKIDNLGKVLIGKVNNNNTFSWKIKTLQFNNTAMDVVIHDLERYFNIKIEYDLANVNDCYFTSPILTNTKLQTVFEILNTSHQAEFEVVSEQKGLYRLKTIDCQ